MSAPRAVIVAAVLAAVAGAGLVACGLVGGGAPIARGWLFAFVLVSMPCAGSLVLLLVHGVTGGRWGSDLAPALVPLARCIPLLLLFAIPILIFRAWIYPWPPGGVHEDVLAYYLNAPFFDARLLIAIAVWSALAWTAAWRSPLWSALGLAANLVIMTFIPADWILTLQPHAQSAGFGLGFGIEQILAALALAAVCAPQADDPRANNDLAGMILTALLGLIYFVYVQFAITWYGNIPDKVEWYVTRATGIWSLVATAAFTIGAAMPFFLLVSPAVRHRRAPLRLTGALVLAGIVLHVAWLIAPAFDAAPLVPGVIAATALALIVYIGMTALLAREVRYGRA